MNAGFEVSERNFFCGEGRGSKPGESGGFELGG